MKGAMNGARAGSAAGPEGALIGAAIGGGVGGFSKDLDKRLTGNSQSGTVEGMTQMAGDIGGMMGGTGGAGKDPSSMMNMFSRGTSTKSSGEGSGLDISKLISSVSGSGETSGVGLNPMAILGGKKQDDEQTNIDAILKMIMAEQNQPSMNFQPNAYSSPRLEMASNRGY